jgi:hypothetical protein
MQPRILLRQQFIKGDILGLGHRQNVWVIMDVENSIPLIYDHTDKVVGVNPERGNPYRVIRSEEVIDRWYGRPIYQKMWDDLLHIDTRLNQIQLECNAAGNIVIVNGKNIKGWQKDKTLRIRSNKPNEVDQGADPREVIHVETIVPQIVEMENSLNLALQRAQAKNGLAGAGQTVTKSLPGTETATGQQILEDSQNAVLECMVKELAKGIDLCIKDFTKIELDNMDANDLASHLGEENALIILDWIDRHKDHYEDAIEVLLAAIVDTTTLDKNAQALQVAGQWIAFPPDYQEIWKPVFEKILLSLDIENPRDYLKSFYEIQAAKSQPAAAGAIPPGQPAAPPAPTAPAPVMG